MRVFLFNPPREGVGDVSRKNFFPFGLLSIASFLKHNGVDVKLVDGNLWVESNMKGYDEGAFEFYVRGVVVPMIRSFNPVVVGVGCLFSGCFGPLLVFVRVVKEFFPDVKVVLGGIHPTLFAKEILESFVFVDFVVLSEGEESFLSLLNCIVGGKVFVGVDGLAYRDGCGKVVVNPKTKFIEDLDSLPFVDYSIVDVGGYRNPDTNNWFSPKGIKIGQPFPVLTSRGCYFNCVFCSINTFCGGVFRVRSVINVLDELEFLVNSFGVTYFEFLDDNLTLDLVRAKEIFKGMISRGLNVQFDTPNGLNINFLDEELIDLMVEAGMTRISLALESGSSFIRNEVIGKNVSEDKVREVFGFCEKHKNLFVEVFLVVGLPEETKSTLSETLALVDSLCVDGLGVFFATPYPGTRLFSQVVCDGLVGVNPNRFLLFGGFHHGVDKPHFKPYELGCDELVVFRDKILGLIAKKRGKVNLPSRGYPIRWGGVG